MSHQKASNNIELIAACGLYCGSCRKYIAGKCPGCKENTKASWCKIRSCNNENYTPNCSQCTLVAKGDCKILNNSVGKVFKWIFKTDRLASLRYISRYGQDAYVYKMTELKQMSVKVGQKI